MMENMNKYVESCRFENSASVRIQSLLAYEIHKLSWNDVGIYFMQHDGKEFLQLTYSHPKFTEIRGLSVMPSLKQIFRKKVVFTKLPVPVFGIFISQ